MRHLFNVSHQKGELLTKFSQHLFVPGICGLELLTESAHLLLLPVQSLSL